MTNHCSIPEKTSNVRTSEREPERLKQSGLFNEIVGSFRSHAVIATRQTHKQKYPLWDGRYCEEARLACSSPKLPFLAYQRMMEGSTGKSNAQSLFGVHQIPSDNHIRDLLDSVKPEQVFAVFEEILQVLEQQGQLEDFRSFADTLLIALDGTKYFGSSQVHCRQCSTRSLKLGNLYLPLSQRSPTSSIAIMRS